MTKPSAAPFRVVSRLGSGGMGEVLLAMFTDGTATRLVAVKRIHPEKLNDQETVNSFLRECKLSALLQHPNVVGHCASGEDDQGPWLALEFVNGRSLGELLQHFEKAGRPLPLPAALCIARDVAAGLQYAHGLKVPGTDDVGIVHRDLSPDNMLIAYDGTAKLADFGIARTENATRITRTGFVRGKWAYMAPEVIAGQPATVAADIFALAAALYRTFTGVPPFVGETDALLIRAVVDVTPLTPRKVRADLPKPIDRWIFAALAKDPQLRPADLRELINALDSELSKIPGKGRAILAAELDQVFPPDKDRKRQELTRALSAPLRPRTASLEKMKKVSRRKTGRIAAIAGFLLALAAAGLVWLAARH